MPDGVLITRPEPGASETAARIVAMGLTAVVAPMLKIQAIPVRLPPPARIAAVLLTSGNAVAPLPPEFHTHPVLTVGAVTARRAQAAGFSDVVSTDGDADALIGLVRQRIRPESGTLLLASGRGQGLALAGRLRAMGFRVARRAIYAARPVNVLPRAAEIALADRNVGVVMFFSAETARQFLRLVRRAGLTDALQDREAITIGPQAAMALRTVLWSRIRVASQPNQDEMLALLR